MLNCLHLDNLSDWTSTYPNTYFVSFQPQTDQLILLVHIQRSFRDLLFVRLGSHQQMQGFLLVFFFCFFLWAAALNVLVSFISQSSYKPHHQSGVHYSAPGVQTDSNLLSLTYLVFGFPWFFCTCTVNIWWVCSSKTRKLWLFLCCQLVRMLVFYCDLSDFLH